MSQQEILQAIKAELKDTPEYYEYIVKGREKADDIWKVFVDIEAGNDGLDQTFEGSIAWWKDPQKGSGDVLSILPEFEQINLRYVKAAPPDEGMRIRIYPPRYLDALSSCWKNSSWAKTCLDWIQNAIDDSPYTAKHTLLTSNFTWLRKNQREIFDLIGYQSSFLQGPPGTGKTTTIGAMLSQYLMTFPSKKILLLSTTNLAVDQALVSVDKSLDGFRDITRIKNIRKQCFRVGNHFIARYYNKRKYLLPVKDESLVKELIDTQARRPDPEKVEAYAKWKAEEEFIKVKIRKQSSDVLLQSRLVAMTTTRAVFTFEELQKLTKFDLIVFDESSQVGLAHALTLAPLGKHCLFAGDPEQLAPIAISSQRVAQRWLGQSIFSLITQEASNLCFLSEQSRMAEPISDLISHMFYHGKLKVASDVKDNSEWKRYRHLEANSILGKKRISIVKVPKKGTWSKKYHGPIRYESAEMIKDILSEMYDEKSVSILTPFRAQRTLINVFLRKANINKRYRARTVHKSQGSEFHTVIFDPVDATNKFLMSDGAKRLLNVALSRAEARVVVILNDADIKNPLFEQILNLSENQHLKQHAINISELINKDDFPKCALGKVIQIKNNIGKAIRIEFEGKKEEKLILLSSLTGQEQTFITSVLKKNFLK